MERFVQYLDDLEDVFYAFPLIWEKIRRIAGFLLFVTAAIILQVLGIALALSYPPVAVALAAILIVAMLYRSAVYYGPRHA